MKWLLSGSGGEVCRSKMGQIWVSAGHVSVCVCVCLTPYELIMTNLMDTGPTLFLGTVFYSVWVSYPPINGPINAWWEAGGGGEASCGEAIPFGQMGGGNHFVLQPQIPSDPKKSCIQLFFLNCLLVYGPRANLEDTARFRAQPPD